jgi:signal transduction histidine kinase
VAEDAAAAWPGADVRCEGSAGAWGDWDPDRLRQALGNLVTNALKHGQAGAPVVVRWSAAPDAALVEVENRGPPPPPELVPHLFEPFRRGEHGGHGLGLFIAREIARAHGGEVTLRCGGGATVFGLRLPRRARASGEGR